MEGTWSLSVVADYWLPVGFGQRGIWVGAYSEGPMTPARDPERPPTHRSPATLYRPTADAREPFVRGRSSRFSPWLVTRKVAQPRLLSGASSIPEMVT